MAEQTPETLSQRAELHGRNNIIIQVQGDKNIIGEPPHLTLTRYLNRRKQDSTDTNLLSPYGMTIPFVGRDDQNADLETWLNTDQPISIRVLVGRAGSGKTRLALEICEEMLEQGWDTGFVTDRELTRFSGQQNLANWGWPRPTLIVIDYAAARARLLHDWFVELADNGGEPDIPLRILLLERQADPKGGWWEQAFGLGGGDTQAVRQLLDPSGHPVELPRLVDPADRHAILVNILEKRNSSVRPPQLGQDAMFDQRLAEISWGGEPLFLMMAGLVAAKADFGRVLALGRTDLAFEIADHEINRIEKIAEKRGIKDDFLSHMAAYVTLCQGLTRTALETAIQEEKDALKRETAGDAYDIAKALQVALPGEEDAVSPILPDMIGEAVMLRVLEKLDQGKQLETVVRAFQQARTPVAASVIRTAQDYSLEGNATPLTWLDRLAQEGAVDLGVLLDIANQLPLNTLVLRERAAEIYAAIVAMARQLVAAEKNEVTQGLLATSLNNLAGFLSNLGRREEALKVAEEAVEIRRQLAAERPDAFLPNLATSLNNLAGFLSDLGRREEALKVAEEAVETLSPYFLGYPSAFAQWMATMLRTYVRLAQDLNREPNTDLLLPLVEALNALQGEKEEP